VQVWKGYIECTNMCGKTFLEDPNGGDAGKDHLPGRKDPIVSTDPNLNKWKPWWVGYEFEDKIGEPVYFITWEIGAGLPQAQNLPAVCSLQAGGLNAAPVDQS
jgi:hypothetical protein